MSNSFVTPWAIAHQAPLSMGFVGFLYPSQRIFLTQRVNLNLLHWQEDFFLTTEPPGKPFHVLTIVNSAAINVGMPVSFQIRISFGYMPRGGIAGSYD